MVIDDYVFEKRNGGTENLYFIIMTLFSNRAVLAGPKFVYCFKLQ